MNLIKAVFMRFYGKANCWIARPNPSIIFIFCLCVLTIFAHSEESKTKKEPKDFLVLELKTDKKEYKIGETIKFALTVRNIGNNPVTVSQPNGQGFDIIVRNGTEKVIWRWSNCRAFFGIISPAVYKHGESKVFTVEWNQKFPCGTASKSGSKQVTAGEYSATSFVPNSYSPFAESNIVKVKIK